MFRAIFLLLWVFPCLGYATVYFTVPQALEKAFIKGAQVEEKRAYLSETQLKKVRELEGSTKGSSSALVSYYVGREKDRVIGTAYLDTHIVRTLSETLMIVVGPEGAVQKILVLSFKEPPDYGAPKKWMEQFTNRKLEPALSLKGDVSGITGASLTARSVTIAVRHILALHAVLNGFTE